MEDLKALQLFQEVLSKTKEGKIRWEPSASEYEYFAVLPGGFTINITYTPEDQWNSEWHLLTLRGEDRELLRVTKSVDGVGYLLEELYELARRQALRVDANVDKLLGELAKL